MRKGKSVSDLTVTERRKIEKLLIAQPGYVLHFSNATFQDFILDTIGLDIRSNKYAINGESKANRLRTFLAEEPNHLAGVVIAALLEEWRLTSLARDGEISPGDRALYESCVAIADRLTAGVPIADLDSLLPDSPDKEFEMLVGAIRDSIARNEPQTALDRLHTYLVTFIRDVRSNRGMDCSKDKEKPLQSIFGEYNKEIDRQGVIRSKMTRQILSSTIGTLGTFNSVRNNESFAHPNPLLNYEESLLIVNNVVSLVRYIKAIERCASPQPQQDTTTPDDDDDLPF